MLPSNPENGGDFDYRTTVMGATDDISTMLVGPEEDVRL